MNILKTNEFKIGIITAASIAILIFGINFLKGVNLMKPANYYLIEYSNVKGLELSSPVEVEGFKVGLVTSIALDYTDNKRVLVTVSLDKQLRIPKGSFVSLEPGLLGGAALVIKMNPHVSEFCQVGDTLIGKYDVGLMGRMEDQILPTVEQMLPRIDSILMGLNAIMSSPALQASLAHIEQTTANLETTTGQLNRMVGRDLPGILKNVTTMSNDLAHFTGGLNQLDLPGTYTKLDGTLGNLQELTASLNSSDGTIGLLMNDTLLYNNLTQTAGSANALLIDLRKNPKRYVQFSVFGKKEK